MGDRVAEFTVAIPVYNGARFIGEALDSIARQDLDGVEVLVSDNASTDATPWILAEWQERLPLRVIRRARTMPMRDHFNALLDAVDGENYMLLCHDDYLASPDALALARSALAEHPEVSAVYCDLLFVNENGRRLARRSFGRAGAFDVEQTGLRTLRTGRNLFGIPLAIRRKALGDLRYGDKFLYTMDIDLSWSLGETGGAWHIAEPLIANRYSAGNTTWGLLRHAHREYIDLAAKHARAPGPLGKARIAATSAVVALQKLAFRAYERAQTRWA